jgi:E1A/CREB-binding protein
MGGGCKICKRIWTLLRYHAQSCKHIKCPIPQCRAIRDRMRQIARKQQMMDDRRRQMINRQYQSNHGAS